jgi:hypothetical protein
MSAFDAVDGASSAVSKCYTSFVESESNKGGEATANVGAEALMGLARTRRRNADKVDPAVRTTHLCHRILECGKLTGT